MAASRGGVVRRAIHVDQGWYSGDKEKLNGQLESWLREGAGAGGVGGRVRAVIAPHAGYSYSGPTAGFAYAPLAAAVAAAERAGSPLRRVFILGPSHHVHIAGCALSEATECATPIGPLPVDVDTVRELAATRRFERVEVGVDEDEHSLEMHMPYVRKCFEGRDVTIVPIIVGATDAKQEARFGKLLAPYLDDDATVFVASSDFCHWGARFRYQHYDRSDGAIHEHIAALDHRGMAAIEAQDADAFRAYLRETDNTICGRHPIGVLLEAMRASARADRYRTSFLRYAQSSPCRKMSDSSVSYASAVVTVTDGGDGDGDGDGDDV